ncbi:MAG: TonB-dependent receptor [Lewinellaceae bacterium]|nr:TonB-dependent receptor [Saprospiraceae bacterium]MCB9331237.1 TonB-dependent receptor [Lewinellaceae bacterium]
MKQAIKSLLLLAVAACFGTALSGQTQVHGRIVETTGEPLTFANLFLYSSVDSSVVTGQMSGEDGRFTFAHLAPGNYRLKVNLVGFASYQSAVFQLKNQPGELTLNDIVLAGSAELAEVEIIARKALVEVRADMLVFNVAANPSASGINGLDLLRKAPGVKVDMDNNILLLGKAGVQVHINGRPTRLSGDDLAALLQNMTSDNVEAIEIISNPSAKYDAEGNAGIINLRLKKNPAQGFNGNLNSSFTQGNFLRYSNGLSLNYGNERIRTSLELSRSEDDRPDYFLDTKNQNGFVLDFDSDEVKHRNGYNLGGAVDVQLAQKHSLSFTGRAILNQNDDVLKSTTGITLPGSTAQDQLLVSQTLLDQSFRNYNFNLNYNWDIDKTSRFATDISVGKVNTRGQTQQPNTFFAADKTTVLSISNNAFDANTDIDMWSAKADYEKTWDKFTFSAGGKFAHIATVNHFAFFNVDANGPVPDPDRSNDFTYTEQVAAAYAILNAKLGEFLKLNAGLRVENTTSRGRLMSIQEITDTDVSRHYTDLFPNVGLSFDDGKTHALNISIGRRVTRPNYQNLNPFEKPLSELTAWKGNPFLRPNYIMNYQVTYAFKQKLTITNQYSVTKDFFASIFEIRGDDRNVIIPRNMGRVTQYSISASYPLEVCKFWEITTFLDGGRNTYKGNLDGTEINLSQTTWSVRVQNSLKLPWGIFMDLTYERYSDWVWRGSIPVRGNQYLDIGFRKDFLDKRLQVRLTGSDIFRTTNDYYYHGNYGGIEIDGIRSFDSQRFGASATWKFGNQKMKAAKRSKGAMEEELRRLNGGD